MAWNVAAVPQLKQVATFDPPSYAMIGQETALIDDNIFNVHGDWEVIESWEGYDGYMIYEIDLPITK